MNAPHFSSMKLCINWESWDDVFFFASFMYTRILYITHGNQTKEHQHKNTFKAV